MFSRRFLIEKQDFRIIDATFQKSENDYFQTQITDYFKSEDGFLIPRKLKLDAEGTSKLDKKQLETSIQRLKTNNDLLKQGVEKLKNSLEIEIDCLKKKTIILK